MLRARFVSVARKDVINIVALGFRICDCAHSVSVSLSGRSPSRFSPRPASLSPLCISLCHPPAGGGSRRRGTSLSVVPRTRFVAGSPPNSVSLPRSRIAPCSEVYISLVALTSSRVKSSHVRETRSVSFRLVSYLASQTRCTKSRIASARLARRRDSSRRRPFPNIVVKQRREKRVDSSRTVVASCRSQRRNSFPRRFRGLAPG